MRAGYDDVSNNRYKLHRDYIRAIEDKLYPFLKVVEDPGKYPSYTGGTEGFDGTALPRVCNPIIAADDNTGYFELLNLNFLDGESIRTHKPASDGYVYREFHLDNYAGIKALSDMPLGVSPTFNDVKIHCELGYLGIRKVKLEGGKLQSELSRHGLDGLPNNTTRNTFFWNFYRQLDVEEQGLSTNLVRANAAFMPGCRMHRMSIAGFLTRFRFCEDSPLIADWDYGYTEAMGPARDSGHVDIKLNPLWLANTKPWRARMLTRMDANLYLDILNGLLRDNADLWINVH